MGSRGRGSGALLVVWLVALSASAHADRIDRYVSAQMKDNHIPGLSLAVIRNGKVVKEKGYGVADVESNAPATPETVYRIASLTKPLVATGVMLLAQEGKLSLDAPIRRYLDTTPDAWKAITVRQLLSHTSGIKDHLNEFHEMTVNGTSPEEIIANVGTMPLNFEPGTKYRYSNTNYLILGEIIRKVTGSPFEAFLADRLFKPLGMTATRRNDPLEVVPNRAGSYTWSEGRLLNAPYLEPSLFYNADAGLLSTVRDLARWDMALEEHRLLTPASREEMWTPTKLKDGTLSDYGLGWTLERVNGHRLMAHTGRLAGTTSVITRYPKDRLTVIVLANQSSIGEPNWIARHVAGLYLKPLMPTDESITDREPETTHRIQSVLRDIQAGNIDSEAFTPEAWEKLYPQAITEFQTAMKAFGAFKSIELLKKEDKDALKVYDYRVIFAEMRTLVHVELTPEGKIQTIIGRTE